MIEVHAIEMKKFNTAVDALVALGGPDELRLQARMLVQELMRRTPPFRGKGSPKGATDRQVGETAVKRDINRAIEGLDPKGWRDAAIKKAFEDRDAPRVQAILRNIRSNKRLNVSTAFAPSMHTNQRRSRGRVLSDKHEATLDYGAWLLYRDKVVARVGKLKASWAAAGVVLGAKIPDYVARHGTNNGSVIDDSRNLDTPSVTVTSLGKGITDPSLMPVFTRALKGRLRAMTGRIKFLLGEIAKKQNL